MSRKKMMLLVGFLAVFVAGGLYYLFGMNNAGIISSGQDPTMQRLQSNLRDLQAVQQSLLPSLQKLFDDTRFQELKQYGDIPVQPGKTGRANPFAPF
ncbi:MAG: hypothetical protein V1778_04190 [bacterium]